MAEDSTSRASRGGHARAAKLTAEERRQIGIAGSLARWGKTLPEARYGSPDRPLRLGDDEISCYVLADGRRVLGQRSFMGALGLPSADAGRAAGRRLSSAIAGLAADGLSAEVRLALEGPILFRAEGETAYGYEAHLLSEICGAILAARPAGRPRVRQDRLRLRCEVLTQWLGDGDIGELVDDAVGLVAERARESLAGPLSTLVQEELRAWVGGFPPEYFEELYRLCGLDYPPEPRKMPTYLGRLTDDVVYQRLGPGTRDELTRLAPRVAGTPSASTAGSEPREQLSTPRLREHMASVVALMRISAEYEEFASHLDTALPRWRDGIQEGPRGGPAAPEAADP